LTGFVVLELSTVLSAATRPAAEQSRMVTAVAKEEASFINAPRLFNE
jgi:hypothetical protein